MINNNQLKLLQDGLDMLQTGCGDLPEFTPGFDSNAIAAVFTEVAERFGDYPATEWIYGFAWPSVEKCRSMGRALTAATDLRAKIARWLFTERLTEWEFGMMVVSEPHSVAEGLWHGVDLTHPLANHPSSRGDLVSFAFSAPSSLLDATAAQRVCGSHAILPAAAAW